MKGRTVPVRQCVGCRERKPKSELIRIVKTPDDEILIDITGRKNGRGMYLCKDESCLIKAKSKKVFEQAFGSGISGEIYEKLKKELALLDSK